MSGTPGDLGVGIDVGGTKILAGALDASGTVLAEARLATPHDAEGLGRALGEVLDQLIASLGPRAAAIGGVGLAVPGLVDAAGVLHAAPNLDPTTTHIDLGARYGEDLAGRVIIAGGGPLDAAEVAFENDATCAALGEATFGAARGGADVIVISLGTGIGAGLIAGGSLVRGHRHYAGEIGHVVVDPDGPPCPCGRRGCWERYASGSGLEWLAKRALAGVSDNPMLTAAQGELAAVRPVHVTEAARAGDSVALGVLDEFCTWLALGLTNVTELLDPEAIVLAGGLTLESDLILGPTRLAYERLSRPAQQGQSERIVLATLGEYAACSGAALLGLRREVR